LSPELEALPHRSFVLYKLTEGGQNPGRRCASTHIAPAQMRLPLPPGAS
jgi:hypothetical protein